MNQTRQKVISKGGSITIPSIIRREYNAFLSGEAVDLTVEDGKLIIAPHTPKCLFCNGVENVKKYVGRYLCKSCISNMAKEDDISG